MKDVKERMVELLKPCKRLDLVELVKDEIIIMDPLHIAFPETQLALEVMEESLRRMLLDIDGRIRLKYGLKARTEEK